MKCAFQLLFVGLIAICVGQGCKGPPQTVGDLIVQRGNPVIVARAAYLTDEGQPALRRLLLYGAVAFETPTPQRQSTPKTDLIYVYVKDEGAVRSLNELGHFAASIERRRSDTWYTPTSIGRGTAEIFVIDQSGLVKDSAEVKWNIIESHESDGSPKGGQLRVNQWETVSGRKIPPN